VVPGPVPELTEDLSVVPLDGHHHAVAHPFGPDVDVARVDDVPFVGPRRPGNPFVFGTEKQGGPDLVEPVFDVPVGDTDRNRFRGVLGGGEEVSMGVSLGPFPGPVYRGFSRFFQNISRRRRSWP
jgi:hypothetical protein